jgi:uncharacterized membrane protein (DUF4010 family)
VQLEDLASRVALSFGIGLLFGLERGWNTREAQPGSRAAGLRTFAISGLLGGILGALARDTNGVTVGGGVLLGAAILAFSGVMMLFEREENRAAGRYSATTAIAAMLAFTLGIYAVLGDPLIAAGSAVAAVAVLAFREGLHGWVARITRIEFESGLALLAMTFIALPIVPNRAVGPLGGVNLREVWILAIILAAVSFAGYVAVKWLGERRGVLVAAAVGGVISSTAVALASARRAAAHEGSPDVQAAGVSLAMAVSFVRVIAIAGALAPSMLLWIAPSLLAATVVAVVAAPVLVRLAGARKADRVELSFRNPFSFWSVVGMAASIGVLIVVGRWINASFGAAGAVTAAATMGLFDVDAMTVSMARLVPHALSLHGATTAVLAGVASNTLVKVIIAAIIGRGRFARDVAVAALVSLLAGALTFLAILTSIPE